MLGKFEKIPIQWIALFTFRTTDPSNINISTIYDMHLGFARLPVCRVWQFSSRSWVRQRPEFGCGCAKNGQVRQEKFFRCAKIYLSVPKYLRAALYFKAWL